MMSVECPRKPMFWGTPGSHFADPISVIGGSAPINRNRRNIARVFKSQSAKSQVLQQKSQKNRRKITEKSQPFLGVRTKNRRAFPRFQNRSVFGTLRLGVGEVSGVGETGQS